MIILSGSLQRKSLSFQTDIIWQKQTVGNGGGGGGSKIVRHRNTTENLKSMLNVVQEIKHMAYIWSVYFHYMYRSEKSFNYFYTMFDTVTMWLTAQLHL